MSNAKTSQIATLESVDLESGVILRDVPIAYHTWGHLSDRGDNAVLICHALTGSSNAKDWWRGMIGPGRAIDTNEFFVVCANTLGSPYGSASPLTVDPATRRPYGSSFPGVTIRDSVAAHRAVLERLGVRGVVAAIGGSMGGMQVLEWAFYPELVRSIVPIAVGGRHSAWCIAWSEAQRQAIQRDPLWRNGDYPEGDPPVNGLATARMIAMISYRSHGEFDERFGRRLMPANGQPAIYAAESYLHHQGEKLTKRFDARCYVYLTHKMDSHDVARGRGDYAQVLSDINQPALVMGFTTDVLYPLADQREIADHMPNARLEVVDAPAGHDSFLVETDRVGRLISDWLQSQRRTSVRPGAAAKTPSTSRLTA